MPDESLPPSEPNPPEPTRFASSDHPSGDTWRLEQTPLASVAGGPAGEAPRAVEVIGDFEVVGKLGQGGMGTVYRARQRSLNRLVALKILPAQLEADADYVARFQREARVAASLNHANLVRVYTSGSAAGCHYIAMELIEGETLSDWVKRGPMRPLEAVRIILAVTQALGCGWRTAHLIHRDIKPGNIFLSHEGAVKLGDLGLAKTLGSDTSGLTQTGAMMGTPHYISPEQARGDKDLDFRADVYSLGCTLYQMLTGQTPYHGGDALAVMSMHLNATPPAILKVLPQCPIPLARLVGKMLKKQRRERHASYGELIAQLESVQALLDPATTAPTMVTPSVDGSHASALTGSGGLQPPEALLARHSSGADGGAPSRPAKSPRALYGGIAAGLLALGIVGYFLWPKEEKLTAAQRWAREHAGDKKSGTEQSDSGVGPVAHTSAVPLDSAPPLRSPPTTAAGWQPFAPDAEWKSTTDKHEFKDGLLHLHGGFSKPQPTADGAIRARIRITADSGQAQLGLRSSDDQGAYKAILYKGNSDVGLNFYNRAKKETIELGRYLLPHPLTAGDTLPMELRIQGSHLIVKIQDTPVIEADDDRVTAPGEWQLAAENAWFESAEVLVLPASTTTTTSPQTIKLWDSAEKVPAQAGVHWKDQSVMIEGTELRSTTSMRDAVLRASIRMNPDSQNPQLLLREHRTSGGGYYRLAVHQRDKEVVLETVHDGKSELLKKAPLPRSYGPDDWLRLELRAIGDDLTISVDGQVLGTVHDTSQPEAGRLAVYAGGVGYFRDIEYVPLDTAGAWRDWVADRRQAGSFVHHPDLSDDGTQVRLLHRRDYTWDQVRFRDGSVRATWTVPPGEEAGLNFRQGTDANGVARWYQATLGRNEIKLQWIENPPGGMKWHYIKNWPFPAGFDPAKEFTLEARALNDHITVLVNGQEIGTVQDTAITEAGSISFSAPEGTLVRKWEY